MLQQLSQAVVLTAVIALSGLSGSAAQAADEAQERAELAKAMPGAKASLQDGLKASVSQGKPISAKFEVEDGKLQLSVYTMKGNGFSEVVVNPASGKVNEAKTITDKEDLEHAQAQKAAMDKAKATLLTAADKAAKSNSGYKVVSVYPDMKAAHPVAEVTLLRGSAFKTVSEKLD
jgi:hypothetical protein